CSSDLKLGEGQGEMQLPDIIKKQEELMDKMQEGMEKGEKEGEGEQGEKGEQKGESGKQGQSGNNGEDGEGESDAEMLYEIYKQQRMLREALQKRLEKEGLGG